MKALLIEKPHQRFQRITGTRQKSGLSNCIHMIQRSVDGIGIVSCDTVEQIKSAIQTHRPSKVIIQAVWVRGEALRPIKQLYPEIDFYAHIHSNIPFLSIEGHAYKFIESFYQNGFGVIFNSIHAFHAFKDIRLNTFFLPNIYENTFHEPSFKESDEFLDIGCFGSVRPMKNHIMQALASIKLANELKKKLRFHTNFKRHETGGEVIKENLMQIFRMNPNHELVSQPWMEPSNFVNSIRKMDINLQLSLSESFNIVAADCVAAGRPLVVSPTIEWVDKSSMAEPNNFKEILSKMKIALSSIDIIKTNQNNLKKFSEISINEWTKFINKKGI